MAGLNGMDLSIPYIYIFIEQKINPGIFLWNALTQCPHLIFYLSRISNSLFLKIIMYVYEQAHKTEIFLEILIKALRANLSKVLLRDYLGS